MGPLRLERLCACASMMISQITNGPSKDGIERLTALFQGFSFSPHSHDTYAIGITTDGVQAFTYRGAARQSVRGQVFVLHPDERHDGRAGDAGPFGYRVAYIDPSLILTACGGRSLPFVREPVSADQQLYKAVVDILYAVDDMAAELASTCHIGALSDVLSRLAGSPLTRNAPLNIIGVQATRDVLMSSLGRKVFISELEDVSGMSRWQLARQFRRAYGVSPYRFHLLRRLQYARALLDRGHSLAAISQACGFADQAHLSRQFKSAYGASRGQWRAFLGRHGTCRPRG